MSDERPSEVLGGLPRTRPHRRSQKRGAPAAADSNPAIATGGAAASTPATRPAAANRRVTPAAAASTPTAASPRRPVPAGGANLIGSAVHVTAELAEIGISAGARALRGIVARLPRP